MFRLPYLYWNEKLVSRQRDDVNLCMNTFRFQRSNIHLAFKYEVYVSQLENYAKVGRKKPASATELHFVEVKMIYKKNVLSEPE